MTPSIVGSISSLFRGAGGRAPVACGAPAAGSGVLNARTRLTGVPCVRSICVCTAASTPATPILPIHPTNPAANALWTRSLPHFHHCLQRLLSTFIVWRLSGGEALSCCFHTLWPPYPLCTSY